MRHLPVPVLSPRVSPPVSTRVAAPVALLTLALTLACGGLPDAEISDLPAPITTAPPVEPPPVEAPPVEVTPPPPVEAVAPPITPPVVTPVPPPPVAPPPSPSQSPSAPGAGKGTAATPEAPATAGKGTAAAPTSTPPTPPPAGKGTASGGSPNVLTDGDGTVVLIAGGNRYSVPGRVPPGPYDIEVTFPGEKAVVVGTARVKDGATITIRCKAAMGICRAS